MQTFRFSEITQLLKHNRHVDIDEVPSHVDKGWQLYVAHHRIHTAVYPFSIIYIDSDATQSTIEVVRQRVKPDTHVVFASSTGKRLDISNAFAGHRNTWDVATYFRSFIKDELTEYVRNISQSKPSYYVNPTIEVPSGLTRKIPNPLLSWLTDQKDPTIKEGAIAILLAAPGQGKTYTCTHIVSEIASKNKFVPLFVDASQWGGMTLADLESLHKTILHPLRHYNAAISWAEGHEEDFIRLSFRSHLFCLIFDGFDEYILRNPGNLKPVEVLEALSALATESGARILITSRTSFWETGIPDQEREQYIESSGSLIYRLMPFSPDAARHYFRQRIADRDAAERAVNLYASLSNPVRNHDFVGRGFVLSLVAELAVHDGTSVQPLDQSTSALDWLVEAICHREALRQQLPLNAREQLDTLCRLAAEISEGNNITSEDLYLLLPNDNRFDSNSSRRSCAEKLKSHPLLQYQLESGAWGFRQEQVELLLLARWLLTLANAAEVSRFATRARKDPLKRQDLIQIMVSQMSLGVGNVERELVKKATSVIHNLVTRPLGESVSELSEGMRMSGALALEVVERVSPRGSQHSDRSEALAAVAGQSLSGLVFSGAYLKGFNLGVAGLGACTYEGVTFVNCDFGPVFGSGRMYGGRFIRCTGVGSCDFKAAHLDNEARKSVRTEALREGGQKYTEDDLRADMQHVLKSFVVKGGLQVRSIVASNLSRGPIGESRYCDEILEVIRSTILEPHKISGVTEGGLGVRDSAAEAVKFHALNNVFTGPLADAYEQLKAKILGG